MPISLDLPEAIRRRIAKLAKAQQVTPNVFMLEAIREKLEAEEARAALHAEARRRLRRMRKAGTAIAAEDVFEYLRRRAAGATARRPKPRRIG